MESDLSSILLPDLESDRRAHNPLNGIGGSNPASAKWASAQQCAGRSLVKVGGT
jgi:hypothetical protein